MKFLLVFLGSGLGGILRYLLSTSLNTTYPLGTFAVNILGCFLIGLLSKLLPTDSQLKLLFITGFCGGFTTFSTFINENFLLLRSSELITSLFYVLFSLFFGLLAAWAGYRIIA